MKRFGFMFLGLALITMTTGCHCGSRCGGYYGPTAPFGGGGGCSSGNCGTGLGAPTYAPQGAYNSYNTYQSTAGAPVIQGTVPTTAYAPLDPLPMY
ncbi:hypothetical protein [Gimesia aquarii]|uniref:Lipoprotein n=1 Tax=Gimesia aquarii TaxID=2527964 RepID=A0A517VRS8_9PLAN|nr:hypothetical protein [Gimesia aquarii]QDT95725.1 hypothetical protein V144x_11720 [Gimesia aquarii]